MMTGYPINSVISALGIISQTGLPDSGSNGGESTLPVDVGMNVPFNLIIAIIAAIALAIIIHFRWYRLPRFPARSAVFSPPAALGLALLMFLLPSVGALLASRAWGISLESINGELPDRSLSELAQLALGAYAAQLVIVVVYIFSLFTDRQKDPAERSSRWLISLLLGGGMLILVWPIMNTIGWLGMIVLSWLTGESPDPIAHTTLQTLTTEPTDLWWWLMVGMVVIAAPEDQPPCGSSGCTPDVLHLTQNRGDQFG